MAEQPKYATPIGLSITGLELAMMANSVEGTWNQNGNRISLHFCHREPKGMVLTNPIYPLDLQGQPHILKALKDQFGIVPLVPLTLPAQPSPS